MWKFISVCFFFFFFSIFSIPEMLLLSLLLFRLCYYACKTDNERHLYKTCVWQHPRRQHRRSAVQLPNLVGMCLILCVNVYIFIYACVWRCRCSLTAPFSSKLFSISPFLRYAICDDDL